MPADRARARSRSPRRVAILVAGLFAATLAVVVWSGYRPGPGSDAPTLTFRVQGLDCALWCSVRVSEGIDALDGARTEQLDREAGTVTVRYDPARQSRASLTAVLEARGFPVLSVGGDADGR